MILDKVKLNQSKIELSVSIDMATRGGCFHEKMDHDCEYGVLVWIKRADGLGQ
jgi:hypothetical protein